jgi:hypothetical protein
MSKVSLPGDIGERLHRLQVVCVGEPMNAPSRALLVLALAACRPAAPQHSATPPLARSAAPDAADWPEPAAPQAECRFERRERCVTGRPMRTALQPHPFHWCPRALPTGSTSSLYPATEAAFSALATRAARLRDPEACCYVDFVATACD